MDKTKFDPQNPYALFSPDQWLNQFSNFNNASLPWPSSYAGTPTDATGKPIQSFVDATNAANQQYQQQLADYNSQIAAQKQTPGTTLNSTPAQNGYANAGPMGGGQYGDWRGLVGGGPNASPQANQMAYNALGIGVGPAGDLNPGGAAGQAYINARATPAAAAPTAPTPPNNWQAMLTGLANPGPVTTPGATVPASASAQPGSANLQSFLANWKPAQSGPGSGFQQNFATALKGMGY